VSLQKHGHRPRPAPGGQGRYRTFWHVSLQSQANSKTVLVSGGWNGPPDWIRGIERLERLEQMFWIRPFWRGRYVIAQLSSLQ
jgi:hypothetical protein